MARHVQIEKPNEKNVLREEPEHSCIGEYCNLIQVLDRNRDLVSNKVPKSQKSKLKRNELRGQGRERAYRILKRILTKDELVSLEDSGDITRLRIPCRIRPGASKFVPSECIARSKEEHRVAFLELEDTEDLNAEDVWENDRLNSQDSEKCYLIGMAKSVTSAGESAVCEVCFHTYRLLTQARFLQDRKFRASILNSREFSAFELSQLLNESITLNKSEHNRPMYEENNSSGKDKENSHFSGKLPSSNATNRQSTNQKHNYNPEAMRKKKSCNDFVGTKAANESSSPLHPEIPRTLNVQQKEKNDLNSPIKKQLHFLRGNTARVQYQISQSKTLSMDDGAVIPYNVLGGEDFPHSPKTVRLVGSKTTRSPDSKCNLIVCHDLFETQERMQIYLSPFVERHKGHKILLWNYPGQAFTSFPGKQRLNNEYHAKCLEKLVEHVGTDGTKEFQTNEPFYILGHGHGGSIACLYAKSRQQPTLKGLILINALSFVDTHFASVIHDCRNVFHCSPEERPDLPLYFYSRFLFSDAYLQKTTTSLALNLYSAVHNPITLKGRICLCDGALDNIDLRGIAKEIFAPIVSIHGDEAGLVRPLHASAFLEGREACTNIYQALYHRGGKKTVVVMTQGGHELLQERKRSILLMIEQILTGNVTESKNNDMATLSHQVKKDICLSSEISSQHAQKHFSDIVGLPRRIEVRKEPDVKHCDQAQRRRKVKQNHNTATSNVLINPDNPAFERQTNAVYKPGGGSIIYPETGERGKSQEFMSWRLRRNRKRLSRFQRAARVIQNSLRVYMAKTMMTRLKRETSANHIQRCYRGMLGRSIFKDKQRELWAARFVQRMYRGSIGRKTSYFKRITKESQICIARVWRGHVVRGRVKKILAHRNFAATNFQSLWRRYLAITLASTLKLRRNSAIAIQRTYRGHLGRYKAQFERDKYLFSRSQSRGIEIGRQLLAEHKTQAMRLQSELSILEKEKSTLEERVHNIVEEINKFQSKAGSLEKSMQEVTLAEVDLKSSLYSSARAAADVSLREKKV